MGSGALQAGVLWLLEERISIRDAEIFAEGKIAESPKFSGEEDSSLQTIFYLIERSELWMEEDWRSVGEQRKQNVNLLIPLCP